MFFVFFVMVLLGLFVGGDEVDLIFEIVDEYIELVFVCRFYVDR